MSAELKEGVQIKSIHGVPGPNPEEETPCWRLGKKAWQYKEIVVREQAGEMGMVPWGKATTNDGRVCLVNLRNVEAVWLLESTNQEGEVR